MKFGPINCAAGDERLHFQSSRVVEAAINKLMPVGKFHRDDFPGGSITIDKKYLETMVANWKAMGCHELPIDYFHRGESENDGLSVDAKKAAGWISKLEVRPDGLYAETKWTAAAKALIDADELRYFSPTFHPDMKSHADGKRQGPTLLGGALLNDPYFKELPQLAANEAPTTKDTNLMDKKLLCAALGIPETSTEAEITAALNALTAEKVKAAATTEALKASASESANALKAAVAEKDALNARVAKIEADRHEEQLTAAHNRLLATGRKVKRELLVKLAAGSTVEAAEKEALELIPATVPMKEVGITGNPEQTVDQAALQAEYDKKLDEAAKAGTPVLVASAQLKRDAKFAPLFPTTIKAAEAN